jgi:Domain of unknown function (DUF5348)
MKITEELIQKIEMAEKYGATEEEIMKLLDLKAFPSEIKEEFNKYKDFVTVSDAAEQLKSLLGSLKNEKAYELKVLRLIEKGEILAEKLSNKEGYRISKGEIARFIEDSKKSKEDWKKEALHYKKLYEDLLAASQSVQEAVQEEEETLNTKALVQEEKHEIEVNTKPKNKKKTGFLEKNGEDGRYYIKGTEIYFTSGETIEFMKNKKYATSTVEHGGENNDYYIVALGKDVPLDGIKVRY